jgi:hypothetical protein
MSGFMAVLESKFQREVIMNIAERLPGSMVFKTDPQQYQGFPDLLILYKGTWGALECKRSSFSKRQPNQEYYVKKLDDMSFSRVIYPENKEEVLNDLEQALGTKRPARLS